MKLLDNDQWVDEQFGNSDLGDSRRSKRLLTVARNMLASPNSSLPQQNPDWCDLKAAYRLFANEMVTFDAIAQQHWFKTRQTQPGRYLLISDTTDINHTSHKATTGLGILGDGVGRGMQLHSSLLYDTTTQLLHGAAGALIYYRKRKPVNETRKQRLSRGRESEIWGELVDQVGSPPKGCRWIHVFDRGGDNFEAMCHIRLSKCDWIIRAAKLNRKVIDENNQPVKLGSLLNEGKHLGDYTLHLRSREGVEARTAKIAVSVVKVTFQQPHHRSPWIRQCGIQSLSMNVVVVKEIDAPKGVRPIMWVLLTSLPVDSFEDAWQIITDYETRWLIEEYHKVIKSACSVEAHSLRDAQRLEPLIALISVVGTRLLQLKQIGRNQPEAKAATHVPASWLKCLKLLKPKLVLTGMTVYTFIRELAKLGGFLARKHDGEPGWQTIWRGFQKMQLLLQGMQLAGAC